MFSFEIWIQLMFVFRAMEIARLTIDVVELVTFFRVCQDAIEQIDTYKNFGFESHVIKNQFDLSKQIFRTWTNNVEINDIKIKESHHSNLDGSATTSIVQQTLRSIEEISHVTINISLVLRFGFTDNNFSSPANDLGALPQKSRHHSSLQISLKRNKIKWTFEDKINFVKQVDVFADLIDKLYIFVSFQSAESRLMKLGTLWNDTSYKPCYVRKLTFCKLVKA